MAQLCGSSKRAATIAAAFPGPVTLRASSRRWQAMLATCAAFAAFGLQLHFDPPQLPGTSAAALIIAAFFSLCALAVAPMLHPDACRLTLDADGFEVSTFFRRRRAQWRQVGPFLVGHVGRPAGAVAYDDCEQAGPAADRKRKIYGHNCALPETFGLEPEALAELLNQWRERALARPR